jgi:hypothetical protein
MEQIKDIVLKVITNISSGRPEVHNKIQRIWQNVFDKKTASHTSIVGLQKGTLVVHVDSPAWLFQMNLQKRKALERLRAEIPELSHIRFKIGKVK